MTIETKYNVGDEVPLSFDHQLQASVSKDGFTTITGKAIAFGVPLRVSWFIETVDPHAYDHADLAHVFAEIIHKGRRFTVAHSYTEADHLSFTHKPDGLWFTIRAFLDLDFFVDSLNAGELWEVGYSYLTATNGSTWHVGDDGKDHRLVTHVERLYSLIIRQPDDRRIRGDDKPINAVG